jgi:hypothetical protein
LTKHLPIKTNVWAAATKKPPFRYPHPDDEGRDQTECEKVERYQRLEVTFSESHLTTHAGITVGRWVSWACATVARSTPTHGAEEGETNENKRYKMLRLLLFRLRLRHFTFRRLSSSQSERANIKRMLGVRMYSE